MNWIKLIRNHGRLRLDTGKPPLTKIYYFLNDDCGTLKSVHSWNDWIFDQSETLQFSNYSAVVKENTDILIGCYLDFDDDEIFYERALRVSAKSLSALLIQWAQIRIESPDEITIYLDGKELSIEWAPRNSS